MVVLQSCSTPNEIGRSGTDVQYTPLSVSDGTDQHISNEVKKKLSEFDEINTIKAVNTPKTVIIAVEIDHNKRFKLETYKKKYSEAIIDEFPEMIVELSTDKKLVIEIDRLEQHIKDKQISQQQLEIKIQKLIKLMRKKT